jgi:protein phosphatase
MRLVLCSDGLHGVLSDEEIGDALRGRPAVDAAAEVLRAAANAGALDDVSVIVCELADGDGEGTSGR